MVGHIDIIKRLIQYRHNHQITQTQLAEIFSSTQYEVVNWKQMNIVFPTMTYCNFI